MDESRKAFESWLMEEFGYRHDYLEYWRGEGDYKSHPDLRSRWQGWTAAWTASRAAIEIELPEVCAWNLCELLAKKEVIEAIRAAGIKVKE
nr:hypothetical protein EATA8330_12400 [Enterobacter asburiae]